MNGNLNMATLTRCNEFLQTYSQADVKKMGADQQHATLTAMRYMKRRYDKPELIERLQIFGCGEA